MFGLFCCFSRGATIRSQYTKGSERSRESLKVSSPEPILQYILCSPPGESLPTLIRHTLDTFSCIGCQWSSLMLTMIKINLGEIRLVIILFEGGANRALALLRIQKDAIYLKHFFSTLLPSEIQCFKPPSLFQTFVWNYGARRVSKTTNVILVLYTCKSLVIIETLLAS